MVPAPNGSTIMVTRAISDTPNPDSVQVLCCPILDATRNTNFRQQFVACHGHGHGRGASRWFWDHDAPDVRSRNDVMAPPSRATLEQLKGLLAEQSAAYTERRRRGQPLSNSRGCPHAGDHSRR